MNSVPGGKVRWGICSAGKISNDFCAALNLLPREEHEIAAVAARKREDAEKLARRFDITRVHGSYEELAQDQELDIIYIGSIHTQHNPLGKLFIGAGHNVLIEKPMALNEKEEMELFSLARDHRTFIMEGFWSRFFPIYSAIREGVVVELGEVQMVHCEFGNVATKVERLTNLSMGGGALMDMGCYTVMLANTVFKGMPKKIEAEAILLPSGVDGTTMITLTYDKNRIARLTTSMTCKLSNTAVISGTKGKLVIPQFWTPVEMDYNGKDINIEKDIPKSKIPTFFTNSEGFIFQARNVRNCLRKGYKESPLMPHEDSIHIIKIMDEVRRQIGLKYPQEK